MLGDLNTISFSRVNRIAALASAGSLPKELNTLKERGKRKEGAERLKDRRDAAHMCD